MTSLAPGTAVRVRADWPERRGPCHVRTPGYLRGRQGEVVRHLGNFANPEDLAFQRPAAPLPLYHVRFPLAALWPPGDGADDLIVELYGTWLEAT